MHQAEWKNGPLKLLLMGSNMNRAQQSSLKLWQISWSIGQKLSMIPPCPDSQFWQMHFDGSKMMTGLGAGIILTSQKGDKLKYVLQIHYAASNNVAEYEALVHDI